MNIIIVGGGFAGVRAALMLSKYNVGKVKLISDEPYFLHHATLYSTATGGDKSESVIMLADIFANHPDVEVIHDKLLGVDKERKLVSCKNKSYEYDQLIIAVGSVTTFFGIQGMAEHAFGIKSLEEIEKFSAHLRDEVIANQHLDKHYYIIGGGPTGTELAAALVEYLRHLVKVHKNTRGKINVTLVEAFPRILPRMSKTASRIITKRLRTLGVRVVTNHKVDRLDGEFITIEGKQIPTQTAVWTSGVANNPFFSVNNDIFELAENGRVKVDAYLKSDDNIFVIGDNNTVKYSGLALPAVRQAEFVAKHLKRVKNGRQLRKFRPTAPPQGVPVGRGWGYVEWHGIYVKGKTGYIARRIMEFKGYLAVLSPLSAIIAWKAHYFKNYEK